MRRASHLTFLLGLLVLFQTATTTARTGVRAAVPHAWPPGPGISSARVYIEPGAGARPVVRLIDRAQRRVYMEMYHLSDRRVVHALERASGEGVDVRVLLEPAPLGLGSEPAHLMDELQAAGVGVRWSSPAFALTHAKFLLTDERVLLVSTANFSRSAFTGNREFLVLDRVPRDVRQASAIFRGDWDRLPVRSVDPNLVVSPDDSRAKEERLIGDARRAVEVYGEELEDRGMEHVLAGARRRGATVRVLLPSTASLADVPSLERSGVEVRTLASPYVHAKAIAVDGREAFVGSENMSSQSLDRNRELGVLLRGAAVRTLEHVFSGDWKKAEKVGHRVR